MRLSRVSVGASLLLLLLLLLLLAQCSAAQHNTAQCDAVQYSTAQHSSGTRLLQCMSRVGVSASLLLLRSRSRSLAPARSCSCSLPCSIVDQGVQYSTTQHSSGVRLLQCMSRVGVGASPLLLLLLLLLLAQCSAVPHNTAQHSRTCSSA